MDGRVLGGGALGVRPRAWGRTLAGGFGELAVRDVAGPRVETGDRTETGAGVGVDGLADVAGFAEVGGLAEAAG